MIILGSRVYIVDVVVAIHVTKSYHVFLRFNVQFVEVPEQRPSVGTDPDTSRQDNSGSHTHNDTHRSQSTFHYQVFDTLDFGPKTAFYRRDTQVHFLKISRIISDLLEISYFSSVFKT